MNKKIIFETSDGINILTSSSEEFNMDDINNIIPLGSKWKMVDGNSFPPFIFLDAMKWSETNDFEICPIKAKEIWKNKFRIARSSILDNLDIEFMKAVENKDEIKQSEIAKKKQSLRDVTELELPNTLNELKNTWPEILGKCPYF